MATAAARSRSSEEPLDTTVRLVTPERITFKYPLAGPFRRSLAYLIDLAIIAALSVAGLFAASILALGSSAGIGLFLVFIFVLYNGYGAVLETYLNGQTIGKRAMGLRVVSEEGVPITAGQAVLRNLLWAFDGIFPFAYMPALACMLLTRRFQRLGDLAAGTMVIVEHRPPRAGVEQVGGPQVEAILRQLPASVEAGPELARALSEYVRRRERFGAARREEMAGFLARPARRRYGLSAAGTDDAVVCALYRRVFLGS